MRGMLTRVTIGPKRRAISEATAVGAPGGRVPVFVGGGRAAGCSGGA